MILLLLEDDVPGLPLADSRLRPVHAMGHFEAHGSIVLNYFSAFQGSLFIFDFVWTVLEV